MKKQVLSLSLMGLMGVLPVSAQLCGGTIADGRVKIENYRIEKTSQDVVLGMEFVLDSLRVPSNRFLAYTPVLRGADGQEHVCQSVLLVGRRQMVVFQRDGCPEYPDGLQVRRYNGEAQREEYKQVFAFADWMDGAEVLIREELCGCDALLDTAARLMPPLQLPVEPAFRMAYVRPPHVDVKRDTLSRQAFLDFPVNRTEIHPDYRNNPKELFKILSSIDTIRNDKNLTITAVSIHGYASPESPYSNNTRLAKGRTEALKEYVRRQYNFPAGIFTTDYTPEDWAGLRRFVASSGYEQRDEMLAIIDGPLAPDPKEWKLKSTFPKEYKEMLRDWYPALRHSDYRVEYIIRGFTVEEAREIFRTKPAQLSLEEMYLVAQEYPLGSDEFREVFDVAIRLYPNDPLANLNAANIALEKRDIESARRYLAKAGDSPEATHARAVLAVFDGDYTRAESLFRDALRQGVTEATDNLQLLEKIKRVGMK